MGGDGIATKQPVWEEPGLCNCLVLGEPQKSGTGSRAWPWNLDQIGNGAQDLQVRSKQKQHQTENNGQGKLGLPFTYGLQLVLLKQLLCFKDHHQ